MNAKAGKKCIGMTKPGKSSGKSISKGKLIAIGPRIVKKERTTIARFKTPIKFSLLSFFNNMYPKDIKTHPSMEDPAIEPGFIIASKET